MLPPSFVAVAPPSKQTAPPAFRTLTRETPRRMPARKARCGPASGLGEDWAAKTNLLQGERINAPSRGTAGVFRNGTHLMVQTGACRATGEGVPARAELTRGPPRPRGAARGLRSPSHGHPQDSEPQRTARRSSPPPPVGRAVDRVESGRVASRLPGVRDTRSARR